MFGGPAPGQPRTGVRKWLSCSRPVDDRREPCGAPPAERGNHPLGAWTTGPRRWTPDNAQTTTSCDGVGYPTTTSCGLPLDVPTPPAYRSWVARYIPRRPI